MPRPCADGQAEHDDREVRACWTFDVEPVPTAAEVAYLRAVFAWSVAIEAACVTAPRTPLVAP